VTTVASRIERVDVYARGAWVTRRLDLPAALPDAELVVDGVTLLADPGSMRAHVVGRRLRAVASAIVVPGGSAPAGPSVERVRSLVQRQHRLEAERELLAARRARLTELALKPPLRSEIEDAVARALAAGRVVDELTAALDARHLALEEELRRVAREIDAARLADAQTSGRERMGEGHPTRRVTLSVSGDDPITEATVTYAVPAARWWPTYTLRLTDGGRKGSWILEALVAQATGEDWSGVALSLATADFASDVRLPELPSLRLGRVQPPVQKGYRPPPEGLDQLFAAADRAFPPSYGAPPVRQRAASITQEVALPPPAPPSAAMNTMMLAPGAMPVPQAPARGGFAGSAKAKSAPVPTGMPMPMPMPMPSSAAFAADMAADVPPAEPPPPGAIEPAAGWLDFDALRLTASGPQRGRLAQRPEAGAVERNAASHKIDSLHPAKVVDPLHSRGDFDHQYVASGGSDVPADGIPHRVSVGSEPVAPRLRWRTVPREAPEVYREAELPNPFPGPLLAGPVDVYLEGTLLVATALDRAMDRGAALNVGLGVDERLRVARNARMTEETAGLLGGKSVVDTTVTIDLRSALGFAAEVEVLDRIPVTSEDELTVEEVASKPPAERYAQKPASPIEGGRRWRVQLPPSGEAKLELRYRLSFSSKQEIVGGNRRD
jgi:Domain of unknown function (DUF4139)